MSEDIKDVSTWPPHKHAFEQLEEQLEYGAQFKWKDVCELMGMDENKRTEWAFLNEGFALKGLIQKEGFFPSERGMGGVGIRLLLREEMAKLVRGKEHRKATDSLMRSSDLSKVPRDVLSDVDVASLDHWENKAACIGMAGKALLRKRKLPSIEMITKSIKELAHQGIGANE